MDGILESETHTTVDIGATQLSQCLLNLPQELYDLIYQSVFIVEPLKPPKIDIDPSYKPPKLLAVDRKSRKTFANSYYGSHTFVFDDDYERAELEAPVKWMRSLTLSHRAMIHTIKITMLST